MISIDISLTIENIKKIFPLYVDKEDKHIDCEDIANAVKLITYVYEGRDKLGDKLTDEQFKYLRKAINLLENCVYKENKYIKDIKSKVKDLLCRMLHKKETGA